MPRYETGIANKTEKCCIDFHLFNYIFIYITGKFLSHCRNKTNHKVKMMCKEAVVTCHKVDLYLIGD